MQVEVLSSSHQTMGVSSPRSIAYPIQSTFKVQSTCITPPNHLFPPPSRPALPLSHFTGIQQPTCNWQRKKTVKNLPTFSSSIFVFLKTSCYRSLSGLLALKSQDLCSFCLSSKVPICLFLVWFLRKLSKSRKEENLMVFNVPF